MTNTVKISIASLVFALCIIVLSHVAITAYAASSLFGGASLGLGYVTLVSDGSDNPGNTSNDYSGISFDDVNGELFSNLAVLSTDYNITDDDCGAGSPRFSVGIDTDDDTVANGYVHIAIGPSPSFTDCASGWQNSGNLIGNEDAGRYDFGQFGGSAFTTYSNAPASVLDGRITEILLVVDSYWSAEASGGDNEQTILVDNVTIAKLISNTHQFDPPSDVTVTIVKYIDGDHATAANATSLSFPMDATWSAANIGSGAGSFALSTSGFNNPNEYEATTADMTNGADYSVSENLTGPTVGASCTEGKPFAFAGYSVGDTEALAAAAATTSSAALTGITSDKFIIVWNETCAPAPTTATITLEKTVINDNSGTQADTAWTLSASGPTPISGVEGNASVTNAAIAPGTYDLSESGPSGYTASAWVCSGTMQNDSDTITAAVGETITCTITNNDNAVPPPPPPPPSGTACDTPGSAPSGYTLQNGTAGRDSVTLAPFTMFVGMGGNDEVNALDDSNYIICLGNGFDRVTVGNGNFTLAAGNNYKNVTWGDGDSIVILGDGPNRIVSGNGDNDITVGNGNNNITTGTGADIITTGNGHNRIQAGGGSDDILTGSGNDNINGGDGSDTCDAGGGYNTVLGCEL